MNVLATMKPKYKVLVGLILLVLTIRVIIPQKSIESGPLDVSNAIHFWHSKTGKDQAAPLFLETYEKTLPTLSPLDLPIQKHPLPTEELKKGIKRQIQLLKFKDKTKSFKRGNFELTHEDRMKTIKILEEWSQNPDTPFDELFDLYQIKGKDSRGNVKFTAYFTPLTQMSYQREGEYIYPIYDKPKPEDWTGPLPTRQEIEQKGALAGKATIVAWAKSIKDIRQMQLQGSGLVRFLDGKVEMLRYSGDNNRAFRINVLDTLKVTVSEGVTKDSVVTRSHSERYIFFHRSNELAAIGAGSVPLVPIHSVATDSRYIPLGTTMLALLPIMNEKGQLLHHELQVLLAQDTGGAIKGPGRIDIYTGVGTKGIKKARYVSHYGKVWLLKPKDKSAKRKKKETAPKQEKTPDKELQPKKRIEPKEKLEPQKEPKKPKTITKQDTTKKKKPSLYWVDDLY